MFLMWVLRYVGLHKKNSSRLNFYQKVFPRLMQFKLSLQDIWFGQKMLMHLTHSIKETLKRAQRVPNQSRQVLSVKCASKLICHQKLSFKWSYLMATADLGLSLTKKPSSCSQAAACSDNFETIINEFSGPKNPQILIFSKYWLIGFSVLKLWPEQLNDAWHL